jgi:hypothetical protein
MLMLLCAKNEILCTVRSSISKNKGMSKSNSFALAYYHAHAYVFCCFGSQTKMSYIHFYYHLA